MPPLAPVTRTTAPLSVVMLTFLLLWGVIRTGRCGSWWENEPRHIRAHTVLTIIRTEQSHSLFPEDARHGPRPTAGRPARAEQAEQAGPHHRRSRGAVREARRRRGHDPADRRQGRH